MVKKVVLVLLTTGAAALVASSAIAAERKGTVTFEFSLKVPADAKDVRLWVPYPQTDDNQQITDVSVTGNFTSRTANREPKNGNSALVADWKGPMAERKLTYSFTVVRKEVVTKAFPKTEGPVPPDMKPYLDLGPLGKSENRVKEIAADFTKGKTTVLSKARAVYDWVVENMRRDPNVKGCGLCEIDRLLVEKGGKCADIHSVFVGLARAAGVPAREIYGIRIPRGPEGDMTKAQHCWTEFYVPGYGWVVADPADVLKFKLEKNPTSEELKAKAEYFFGAVDESRISFGTGRNIILSPPQAGGPLNYFMYPYAEADGKPLGEDLYGFNIGYTIRFQEKVN